MGGIRDKINRAILEYLSSYTSDVTVFELQLWEEYTELTDSILEIINNKGD